MTPLPQTLFLWLTRSSNDVNIKLQTESNETSEMK